MVVFQCACGQRLSGPAGEIIHCPKCFETVGVPKPMPQKQKPILQPAPEPEVAPPPTSPQEMKRFVHVWVLASALQFALLAASGICLIATVVMLTPHPGNKTSIDFAYPLSAALSGLVTVVLLQAAKAILEMADRDERRAK